MNAPLDGALRAHFEALTPEQQQTVLVALETSADDARAADAEYACFAKTLDLVHDLLKTLAAPKAMKPRRDRR